MAISAEASVEEILYNIFLQLEKQTKIFEEELNLKKNINTGIVVRQSCAPLCPEDRKLLDKAIEKSF